MFVFESVKSSYIGSVAYNEENKELRIQFKNGVTWKYFDVPAKAHVSLLLAESTGRFFAKEIKGVFKGQKIEHEEQ